MHIQKTVSIYLFLLYVTKKDTKPKRSFFRVVQIEQRPRFAGPLFCFHAGPPPTTLDQHENNSGSMSCVYWAANTFRYPNPEQAVRKQPQLQRHLIIARELCCKIRCFLRLPCKVGGTESVGSCREMTASKLCQYLWIIVFFRLPEGVILHMRRLITIQ